RWRRLVTSHLVTLPPPHPVTLSPLTLSSPAPLPGPAKMPTITVHSSVTVPMAENQDGHCSELEDRECFQAAADAPLAGGAGAIDRRSRRLDAAEVGRLRARLSGWQDGRYIYGAGFV